MGDEEGKMLRRNKGGGEDRGARGRPAGGEIFAHVNSDTSLPKCSPLSLQQAFTLQQNTDLIQPSLLCTPIM